jgi:molybdate transport system permease protein
MLNHENAAKWQNRLAISVVIIVAVGFILFTVIPILAVFLRIDPSKFWEETTSPGIIQAIVLSFYTSTIASVICLGLAIPTAYILARRKFPGKSYFETLLGIPIVLPPAVAGVALLWAFAPRGLLGPVFNSMNIIIPGSTIAVIIAQVFTSSPYILRTSKSAFQGIDMDLLNSARILTTSKVRVFFTITLPLSRRQILSGFAMTWARAIGEFGAILMFAGDLPGITQTMPIAIYSDMIYNPLGASVLSIILIILSFFILFTIRYLEQNTRGGDRMND